MRVMVVDGGGRGQAMGEKLANEGCEVFISPGNPGNRGFAYSTGKQPTDIEGQLDAAKKYGADLTVVGADDPLGAGIVDAFQGEGLSIFGPTRAQARIESDRDFAKKLATKNGIPTGPYELFERLEDAMEYTRRRRWPLFAKDNGLAQGKGAKKCNNIREFEENARAIKNRIVVEDYITGPEASLHGFCDGRHHVTIPFLVRDHKQVSDDADSPMTGGMGVVGPLPHYAPAEVERLGDIFISPVVRELGFRGVLFAGLKGEKENEKNLEWNARPGDPEMQVFLSLMESQLLSVVLASMEGDLDKLAPLKWNLGQTTINLVLAAKGYPKKPIKGQVIEGLDQAAHVPGVKIIHAGTSISEAGNLVTAGGRVLNIISKSDSPEVAVSQVYDAAGKIGFSGEAPIYRRDIGRAVLEEL